MSTPCRAAVARLATTVTGVERTRAQGQAVIKICSAKYTQRFLSSTPAIIGIKATPAQAATTNGVYQAAKRETRDSIGDCLEVACTSIFHNGSIL